MTTLAAAMLEVARIVGSPVGGTSTAAGTTATLIDTGRVESDNYFNDGTIWFTSGDLVGLVARITDYTLSSGTITFDTQAKAPGSGKTYRALNGDFPETILMDAVNDALKNIGAIPVRDTTLVSVADQEEYDLPTGVYNVRMVEIAQSTTEPYSWMEHNNWDEIEGHLVFDPFDTLRDDGMTIRLTYQPLPDVLDAGADEISDQIPLERLAWEGAVYALRWRLKRVKNDPIAVAQLNEALQMQKLMEGKHPVPRLDIGMKYSW